MAVLYDEDRSNDDRGMSAFADPPTGEVPDCHVGIDARDIFMPLLRFW